MIEREDRNGVRILRLAHGKANAFDTDLAEGVTAAVDEAGKSDARAVVITGTGHIFSAGVNLVKLAHGGPDYLKRFLPALGGCFRKLLSFPKPVVAAVNGHAIAGGAVFACVCDHRVMARGNGRFGLPELLVGVPFPQVAVEVLRGVLPPPGFEEAVYTGESYPAENALARGFVHELVEPDALLDRAVERARQFGAIPPAAFSLTKSLVRRPAIETLERDGERAEAEVLKVWATPEVVAALRAYVEKVLGK